VNHFTYRGGELCCEDVTLRSIAEKYGTPCYVYSHATLARHFRAFDEPFAEIGHLTCFSVKACSNLAILRLLANLGGGFDVVSGGELFRVLAAGGDPGKVVYSGVGKTADELRYALEHDILMFNIESESELYALDRMARALGKTARVSLRVNPAVDPMTHPYIATGLREAKFGIDVERSLRLYTKALELEHVDAVGVDCHIGSQLTQTAPFMAALSRLTELTASLRAAGVDVRYLDLGGGLGITYNTEKPPLPQEYAREVLAVVRSMGVTLVLEPGRVIVGNAAALLASVLYLKDTPDKRFVITDMAMNDCIRPTLYGAYHEILPVAEPDREADKQTVDVVGPICESGDFMAKNRQLPPVKEGGLVALMSAGAYCASMASNYNSRPRAPEVLVVGNETHLIRRRETWADLTAPETVPEFLQQR
jgi:diaminopimelate decarboxylase